VPPTTDLLQGTLDLLILKTSALEPMHGWGIAQRTGQKQLEVELENWGRLSTAIALVLK
jgi:PadR family transcriptional regulator PadR